MDKERVCRNKKCQKPLPAGYKHKYCESCRNQQADKIKKGMKAAATMAGVVLLSVATKGKISIKK